MTTLTILAISFVLVGGITFAIGAVLLRLLPAIRAERLAAPSTGGATVDVSILRWEERYVAGWRAAVERLGRWLTPRDAGLFAGYRRRLVTAGFHNPRTVTVFLGAKGTIGLALGVSYVFYAALVQRALKSPAAGAWRMDNTDVNLIFAGAPLTDGMRAVH